MQSHCINRASPYDDDDDNDDEDHLDNNDIDNDNDVNIMFNNDSMPIYNKQNKYNAKYVKQNQKTPPKGKYYAINNIPKSTTATSTSTSTPTNYSDNRNDPNSKSNPIALLGKREMPVTRDREIRKFSSYDRTTSDVVDNNKIEFIKCNECAMSNMPAKRLSPMNDRNLR